MSDTRPIGEGAASDAPPPGEASARSFRVQLPEFEGPLDLLLHLILTHELDILDLPIGFVTEKYVEYIEMMHSLNIDLASEFLVMAAELTRIKSKMLLPQAPEEDDAPELEEDPRAELIRRLLEYQKYKLAAESLADQSLLGRDVFARGTALPDVEGPVPLAAVTLYKLIDAFQGVLERTKVRIDHEVDLERISITERITQISDLLQQRQTAPFESLFQGYVTRADLIVTFLALLEMTRLRMIRLAQDGPLEPISIELAVTEALPTGETLARLLDDAAVGAAGRGRAHEADDAPLGPSHDAGDEPVASDTEGEVDGE